MVSTLNRTIAWLCLALALLTGLSPAQGFVLCIETDGCVTVELKDVGLDSHQRPTTPRVAPP